MYSKLVIPIHPMQSQVVRYKKKRKMVSMRLINREKDIHLQRVVREKWIALIQRRLRKASPDLTTKAVIEKMDKCVSTSVNNFYPGLFVINLSPLSNISWFLRWHKWQGTTEEQIRTTDKQLCLENNFFDCYTDMMNNCNFNDVIINIDVNKRIF